MPVITEVTAYGYRTALSDPLTLEDIDGWVEAIRGVFGRPQGFGQLVDNRDTDSTRRDPHVAQALRDAMMLIRSSGLPRTAVIVADQVAARRLRSETRRYLPETGERFIDARERDGEQAALARIMHRTVLQDTHAALNLLRRGAWAG